MVPRSPPGGENPLCKTSDHPSHKLSKRKQRERFLHDIISDNVEGCLRYGHCAALAGCRYRGRLVGLHSIYRIRGPMGRVSNGCFFDSSTVRVIGSESHVALDLAFLKPQGKRRLNAAQCPLWVTSGHSTP